jgi:hypothetical protein
MTLGLPDRSNQVTMGGSNIHAVINFTLTGQKAPASGQNGLQKIISIWSMLEGWVDTTFCGISFLSFKSEKSLKRALSWNPEINPLISRPTSALFIAYCEKMKPDIWLNPWQIGFQQLITCPVISQPLNPIMNKERYRLTDRLMNLIS